MDSNSFKDIFQWSDLLTVYDSISNIVLITNLQLEILFCNEAFCNISGFTRDEVENLSFVNFLSPESSQLFDNHIKKNLENVFNWKGELEHIRKDNTKYWTTGSFTKIQNLNNEQNSAFLIIEDDISYIKELTSQLEYRANLLYEEKLKIENIVNNIPYSIIVLEKDGTILYQNEIFKTSFKNEFQRELLINSNIDNYSPNVLIESIKIMMNYNEKRDMIINLKSNVHLQINIIPLNYSDDNSIFITVIRDITNFIEFDLMQKQFVTTVSHELRTPIASILLSINNYISYREKLNEEQNRNLLTIIQQNANVLKNIVEDLLIISHIDNKKLQLRNWIQLNLSTQIKQVIMQLEPQAVMKNIEIQLNCEFSINIYCDDERLSQILRIPLENAIKYSFNDQIIIINCMDSYIGPYNSKNEKGILISIKDFGLGIKSSELKFLFRRFFRGSNVQHLQGTGIGLSILKELVNLLKGSVFVESTENTGTEILIFLPNSDQNPIK